MKPRYVFLGTPRFSATVLTGLLNSNWKPELVISEPAKPSGRNQQLKPSAVAELAKQHDLPLITPTTKDEITLALAPLKLDLAIVVAYGKIIPQAAIALPTHGIINVHASLLPKYRGASPIQAAILAGDSETGISYMLIEPTLDTGPIVTQIPHPLSETSKSDEVFEELATLTANTIVPSITAYLDGSSKPKPQNNQLATYTSKLSKEDGQIKLAAISPIKLDRLVRAYTPWPGVYTTEFDQRLLIRAGHLKNDRYFIDELQWEGKRPVDAETFARAYPDILTHLPQTITLTTSRNSISGSND